MAHKSDKQTYHGHEVILVSRGVGERKHWVFTDTLEPCKGDGRDWCGKCGQKFITENHESYDPCIKQLPGVMNACCGHGVTKDAYVQFWALNNLRFGGRAAIITMWILKQVRKLL